MSDNENTSLAQDEMTSLKSRADMLGVTYHPSIGLDKLREKVNAALASNGPSASTPAATDPVPAVEPETPNAKRLRLKRDATKLVRVRVTCMNPIKKEWDGEIFTAGNAAIGSVKKYVPFNTDEEGWHVPNIILQMMQERMCQIFTTVTDSRGNKGRKGKLIREFVVEVLPPLTKDELNDLAVRQAAAKSIE
jgi:hypothetical protein